MRKLFIIIIFLVLLTSPSLATDYYVKNGGSDGNTGLSDAQAWETIAKVNSSVSAIDSCVYFKCGDTWYTRTDARLIMDWSGTDADNRAIVGAYYMDGENEVVGVNVDGKPVIDGGWDLSTFEVIARRYEFQVYPYGVDYVAIQDLKIINSHGYGLSDDYVQLNTNVIIRRVEIQDTGRGGIRLYYSGAAPLVEYCLILRDNRQYFINESTNWDSGIRIKGDGAISRYNEVGHGWGEGIGLSQGGTSSNCIVENNLIWGRQSVGIYAGCCSLDGIVRNNIIIGTTDTDYHKPYIYGERTWGGAGLGFNQEKAGQYSLRNKFYNNIVIGCSTGIQLLNKQEQTVGTTNRNYVYNNTFIDNWHNIWTHVSEEMDAEFKNNLSYISTEGAALGCKHVFYYANVGPTDVYRPLGNFWSSTPERSQWEHANDVIGDPKISRTSSWLSISEPSDIDIATDIAILSDSAAIDAAQDLGATYDAAFIEGCDFNTPDASDISTPIVVVLGDQDNYGSGWDFGAYIASLKIFGASPVDGATGISITVDLNWSNPIGETSIDLLFDKKGEHDPPTTVKLNDQDQATWDCGTLDYNTEYAWRVDVNHAGGTETGTVYYFTTTTQANPPILSGGGMTFHKEGVRGVWNKNGIGIK